MSKRVTCIFIHLHFFLYHHHVGIFPQCLPPKWDAVWDCSQSWHIKCHWWFGRGPKQCLSRQGGEPACLGDDAPGSGDALATPLLSCSVSQFLVTQLRWFLGPLLGNHFQTIAFHYSPSVPSAGGFVLWGVLLLWSSMKAIPSM